MVGVYCNDCIVGRVVVVVGVGVLSATLGFFEHLVRLLASSLRPTSHPSSKPSPGLRLQNIGLGLKGTKWIMTGVAKTYLADVLLDGLSGLILSWNLLKGGLLPRP